MKKLLFFLLVLGAVQAKAQVIKGSIDLRDSTINRSIPFEVPAGTKLVKYDIKVYADVGEITVSLSDPNDKKSMNVTLGTKTSGQSTCEPSRSIRRPETESTRHLEIQYQGRQCDGNSKLSN